MNRLLSGEKIGSAPLAVLLGITLIVLLGAPFIFELLGVNHSERAMKAAVQIIVFIILAASYDLLIGYTAIISLCHSVFFAIGAYSLAIIMQGASSGWENILLAFIFAGLFSAILAGVMALIGIRVKNIYFTLVTFAFAFGAQSFVIKLSEITGGISGLTFDEGMPSLLTEKVQIFGGGEYRIYAYYLIFLVALALLLIMLRLVSSPFGKVLLAVRENEFRCGAIGFRAGWYKAIAIILAAVIASIAGVLYAGWVKIAVPNSFLNIEIMLMILIIVMVGGKGSIYGTVVGAVIIVLMENYLSSYLDVLFQTDFPERMQMVLTDPFYILDDYVDVVPIKYFFNKNRWALYIGLFYIFSIYYFRLGIVGKLREIERLKMAQITLRGFFEEIKGKGAAALNKCFVLLKTIIFLSAIGQMFTGLWNLNGNNGEYLVFSSVLTYLFGVFAVSLKGSASKKGARYEG